MMWLWGCCMLAAAGLIVMERSNLQERRRQRCSGCRVEALGSSMLFLEHTCERSRAHYRDRRGRVYAFGQRDRWAEHRGYGAM